MAEEKMESVEDLMREPDGGDEEAEDTAQPEPAEPPAETGQEQVRLAPSGFPNPLGIELTKCHLPKEFLDNKRKMGRYVYRYFKANKVNNIVPTENEQRLYEIYLAMFTGATKPGIRVIAAAIRLIVAGKSIEVARDPEPEELTF